MSARLFCGFCGKGQDGAAHLIAGPVALICDECVELCAFILCEQRCKTRLASASPSGADVREIAHTPIASGRPRKIKTMREPTSGPGLSYEGFEATRRAEASPQALGPADE